MLRAGDFKRAEEEYADIKRRAPDYPAGYVKLSACYMTQKKWDKAIAELEQAVRIHPELWSITNDLATLLSEHGSGKKDLDRAFVLGEKAKSLSPDNATVFDTVGWIDYRRGDMNQAFDWLSKAQAKVPGNPVFNYHLGMAYFRAGNTAKAKEYIQIALASKVSFLERDEAEKAMAGIH
jgi:Tfp pilus assembly protein PilF